MAEAATADKNTAHEIQTWRLEQDFNKIVEASGPWAINLTEMESDEAIRLRTARFIGGVMLAKSVHDAEVLTLEKPINSLRDAIRWGAEGDKEALKLIETNVMTDVIERTLKSGHVMDPIRLDITESGKIIQYNQTGDSIHANSLQLAADNPVMRARTEAEARNNFRIEERYSEGWFDEHSLVVFSLAEDLPDIFFTDTMSCSIQVTSKAGKGLQLESAFVAGVYAPGEKEHDMDTIIKVGDMLGIDFRNKTKAEILDTPLFVPNKFINNGVIDMVKLWDTASGGFFGESKQAPMDYQAYRAYCRERTKSFQPKVEIIRDLLIADAPYIKTRLQAVERLHKLSEEQMVLKAIEDRSIDPRVFGGSAAQHIILARYYEEQGQSELANQATNSAIRTADSKSCPWAKKNQDSEDDSKNDEHGADEDEFGSLTFYCTENHWNRRPRGQLISKCRMHKCKGTVGC